jgi:hypothetical protein
MPYADPERRREFNRQWMTAYRAAKPEDSRALLRRWQSKNPDYRRVRYQTNEQARLTDLLRAAVRCVMIHRRSNRDWDKDAQLRDIIGCGKLELRAHIEAQFLPGMVWENYGRDGWEIDHIKPCASFDLTDPDRMRECFHYTNLRPLWRIDNMRRPRKEGVASWQ